MTAPRRPSGRSVLVVMSVMMMAGGSIRLGTGFGMALAATGHNTAAPSEAQRCAEVQVGIAKALLQREQAVETKEAMLAAREARIAKADAEIATRTTAMAEAEARLRATITQADSAAEQDLLLLTQVYQSMKAKDAARLFASMDPQFAAGFIGRMRSAEAANILAGMAPETAYAISALLAGRNSGRSKR